MSLPQIRLAEHEAVTEEAVSTTLKRAISRYSTLQAHDGHWPGDYGGPMFLMPGLVIYSFDWIMLILVHNFAILLRLYAMQQKKLISILN